MEKNCNTCRYNVEDPPAHTCDVCDSLDTEEYYMWTPKETWSPTKNCDNCEHGDLLYESKDEEAPEVCQTCWNEKTNEDFINWRPKVKSRRQSAIKTRRRSKKSDFYVKLVYDTGEKEEVISKIKLSSLIESLSGNMVDSIYKAMGMR